MTTSQQAEHMVASSIYTSVIPVEDELTKQIDTQYCITILNASETLATMRDFQIGQRHIKELLLVLLDMLQPGESLSLIPTESSPHELSVSSISIDENDQLQLEYWYMHSLRKETRQDEQAEIICAVLELGAKFQLDIAG